MVSNKNILYLNYVYSKKVSFKNVVFFDNNKKANRLSNSRERT